MLAPSYPWMHFAAALELDLRPAGWLQVQNTQYITVTAQSTTVILTSCKHRYQPSHTVPSFSRTFQDCQNVSQDLFQARQCLNIKTKSWKWKLLYAEPIMGESPSSFQDAFHVSQNTSDGRMTGFSFSSIFQVKENSSRTLQPEASEPCTIHY